MSLLLLLACSGADKSADDTAGADLLGTITAARGGEAATVSAGSAWGFNSATNGKAVFFLTASPDVDCGTVGEALGGPEDPDWDRDEVFPPETCTVFAYVDYLAEGVTWTDADPVSATVSLSCTMDPGSWETSPECAEGVCYTGHYWQGTPTDFDLTLSGGDGEAFAWSLRMDGYEGQFTYEELEPAPASGRVEGAGAAGWCGEIGQTSWFSQ